MNAMSPGRMYRFHAGLRRLTIWLCCLGLTGCEESAPPPAAPPYPQPERLVVVTPHNEMIRGLFERSFSEWNYQTHKKYVEIEWIAMGTPQCVQYVQEASRSDAAHAGRAIPDLMFGGGVVDHGILAEKGLAKSVDLGELEAALPAAIAGIPTRDPQNRWHSSALSGFGMMVNRKGCAQRGIAEPAHWTDLADPRFFGWLAIADPERSGSHRQCLSIVLQKYGWDQGWATILRMAANSRALAAGSDDATTNVASGLCLAGFSVNFNALRVVEEHPAGVLAYVNPADASAITPDVVTVLTYGAHPELAERFVRYCVGDDGQKAWALKADARGGYNDTLYRYPINPKFYGESKAQLGVSDNPMEMPSILPLNPILEERLSRVIAPLFNAACGEHHVMLQECWRRLIAAGLPAAALAEFSKPVLSEAEAVQQGAALAEGEDAAKALVKSWSELFQAKYEKVTSMLPPA